ncbi:hypothetical protein EGW08_012574 [Elysia chlorotica]|uniref:Ig-like domain-containing protein n=1 Tax=Elysia chlorotica TaxID=188477 RepID=A0A433TDF8_ELYCH|nr:hypothetical protein EGW08_012574 [Elysia chlorotica]
MFDMVEALHLSIERRQVAQSISRRLVTSSNKTYIVSDTAVPFSSVASACSALAARPITMGSNQEFQDFADALAQNPQFLSSLWVPLIKITSPRFPMAILCGNGRGGISGQKELAQCIPGSGTGRDTRRCYGDGWDRISFGKSIFNVSQVPKMRKRQCLIRRRNPSTGRWDWSLEVSGTSLWFHNVNPYVHEPNNMADGCSQSDKCTSASLEYKENSVILTSATHKLLDTCCSDSHYFFCADLNECACHTSDTACAAVAANCQEPNPQCLNLIGSYRCVDLLPAPGLTFDTSPTTLSVGTNVTLKCSIPLHNIPYKDDIPSSTPWTFEWIRNGRRILNDTEDSLCTISNLSSDKEGRYECVFNIGSVRSAKSAALDITIRPLTTPVLTAPQADVSIGEFVNLTCSTTSPGDKLYEWTLPSGSTLQTSEEILSFQMTGWQNLGFYTCRVIIQAITSTSLSSTPFQVGLKLVDPLLNITGDMTSFGVNETVELRCSTPDSSTFQWLVYKWLKDGAEITCCGAELSLLVANASIEGVYKCFTVYGVKQSQHSNEIAVQYRWSTVPQLQVNTSTLSPGFAAELMCSSAEPGTAGFELLKGDQVAQVVTAQCSTSDASLDQQCWSLAADRPSITGTYVCRVIIANSLSPLSNSVIITTEDIETPTITADPSGDTIENSITLNCSADTTVAVNYPQLVYVFEVKTRNGTVKTVMEGADQLLNITSFTSTDEGNYWCLLKNDWLLSNKSNVIYLAHVKYEVKIKSTAVFIPEHKEVTVTCSPSWNESAPHMFRWFRDTNQINSQAERSIVIQNFSTRDEGDYSCQAYRSGSGEWVSSNTTALALSAPYQVCSCPCANSTPEVELTQALIEQAASQIREQLVVRDSLSQRVRSKTSAEDHRATSTACGGATILLLVVIIAFVIYIDGVNLVKLRKPWRGVDSKHQNMRKLRGSKGPKPGPEKYERM